MSTTVDSRVVEMRFDNKQFESNVSNTMSTLDKLKQKLHFPGAAKSIEDVGTAAKNVNMNGLGSAVENVQAKFSALQVIGVTALANITNSAVNAGKKMVAALTIDPIKTGFNEYELKMDSVKTIMASTGESIEKVTEYLNELNTYSDQTIYSFSDMTQNIGKFTNAGVKLEDAVMAIQGISNEAAVSGANANEASRAMYNFAQALSAGYVKLIDWKSVENANMAIVEFKQQLIDTAVELGVVTKAGDMYTTSANTSFNATKNFNDTLKDEWMTSEVLIETLKRYADSNTEIGKKAFAAAQDVTKLTQVFDILKETAQSGWAQTWEIIFGNMEEAKAIFTPLTDFFSKIINKISDFRNNILRSALVTTIAEKFSDLFERLKAITDKVKGITSAVGDVVGVLKDYNTLVDEIIAGKWGNQPTRWADLTAAGYDWAYAQNLVNERLGDSTRHATNYTEAQKGQAKSTGELTKANGELLEELVKLSDEELKAKGLTRLQIYDLRTLAALAKKLGVSVSFLVENADKINGRWLMIEGFKNIGKSLVNIFKAIGDAWKEIFTGFSEKNIADTLFDLIAAFHRFSVRLKENVGDAENFKRTFKGIFALLDIVLTLVGGPLKIAFKLLSQLLGAFDLNIIDITACIGDVIVKFRDWLKGILDFEGAFKKIVNPVKNAIKSFKEWINTLKESENLPQDIANGIVSGFGKMIKAIGNFFKSIPKLFTEGFDSIGDSPLGGFLKGLKKGFVIAGQTIAELGKIILNKINEFLSARGMKTISTDAIAGLVKGFKEGASKVWNAAVEMVKNLVDKVKDFLGIHSPSVVFMAIGGFIIAGLISGLKNSSPKAFGAFQDVLQPMIDFLKNIDFGAILAGIIGIGAVSGVYKVTSGLGDMLGGLGDVFEGTGKILIKSAGPIKKILKNTAKVVKSFSKVLNAVALDIKLGAISNFVKTLTQCILMLVAAVAILTFFDKGEMWNAVGIIAVLAAVMVLVALAMNKISNASATVDKNGINIKGLSSGLTGIGVAILLLGITAKMLGTMNPEQLEQGFWAFVGILAAVGALLIAFMKIPFGPSDAVIITNLGKTMTKMAIALLLMTWVVSILGKMSLGKLVQGTLAIAAFSGIIVGLMAATKFISGSKNVDKIGSTLLKISIAIGLMVWTAKSLGKMSLGELTQGTLAIAAFSGIIVGLMAATKLILGSKNVDKIGGTLLKIGVAIGIMGLVCKLLGGMSTAAIIKGTLAITAFGGIIVGLMTATKLASGGKKIGGTILAVSGAIAILAFTALMLSMISWEGFAKGIIMITVFSGIIVGLMAATKLASGSKNIGKTLIMISAAIGILALIAVILGLVPVEKLVQGVIAVTILSALIAGLIYVTSLVKKDVMTTLLGLAAVIAVLGGILITLSCLKPKSVMTAAISLGGLLAILSGVLALMIPIGKKSKQAMKGVLALATLAVPLALFGLVLAMMSALKVTDAMPNAVALGVLCLLLTPALYALSAVGNFMTAAMKGMLALASLAVPLALFGLVLAMMSALKVTNAIPNAIALSILCTVLTKLLIPLSVIGILMTATGGAILLGVVGLLAMAVPLVAFVGILALMSGIENSVTNALVLALLMTVLTNALLKISLAGPLAAMAVSALWSMVGVMSVFGVLATAIGALLTAVPEIEQFLDKGIAVLEKLAHGLGSVVGNLISGFLTGAMSGLPQIGTMLSKFMLNAMPFIVGAKMIDAKTVDGVKSLADVILTLTGVGILEGLASLFTGGSSIENFAAQLPILGRGLAAFSESLGSFSADQLGTVMCAAQAVKMLASAAADIPNTGGLLASIVGENDLGNFAAQFPILGTGIRSFLDSIGTFSEEEGATVTAAAKAIKSLASAASEIPNSGGWAGKIIGENDLGTFAAQFPILGMGLRMFLTSVGTFSEAESSTVTAAADAVKALASAASEIPNAGGLLADLVGDNDLGTFASQFPIVGMGIRLFLLALGTFSEEEKQTIECAVGVVKSLAAVSSEIPNTGGWLAKLVGDNDLGTFASQFPKVGTGIAEFAKKLGTFKEDKVTTIKTAISAIKTIASLGKLDLGSLNSGISTLGTKLVDFGKDIKSFSDKIGETSSDSLKSAIKKANSIINFAKTAAGTNVESLKTFGTSLKDIATEGVKGFVDTLGKDSYKDTAKEAAKTLAGKFKDALDDKNDDIKTKAEEVGKSATGAMDSKAVKKDATAAGKNVVTGFANGIKNNKKLATDAGSSLGKAALKAAKEALDENSPSKEMYKVGDFAGQGFVNALYDYVSTAYDAGGEMGDSAKSGLNDTIARIADIVNSDIDTQPTIRPVLDLSDIKTGASALGSMLNLDSSVGVRANVGAISTSMSRNQNRNDNSEIVSTIKALRKDIANMPRDSVNINGITYSGDSEINNAVQTLVRAARIERRA